jgi:quinoprotein glucose dehydrogenase
MMHPDWNGYPPQGQTWTRGAPTCGRSRPATSNSACYLPMGNSAADYYSSLRRPEEDYATSLVALDVTTGKPRWHFQAVRKDVWDDLGAQATLIDYPSANGPCPPSFCPASRATSTCSIAAPASR